MTAVNQLFPILNEDGSDIIPTTDGIYYTANMSSSYDNSRQFYIEFFSDALAQTPVSPTAGTFTALGTPMGNVWLSIANGQQNANTVTSGINSVATYIPPTLQGRIAKGAVKLEGITGASHAKAYFWSFPQ